MALTPCSHCGKLSSEHSRFCVNCGITFNKAKIKTQPENQMIWLSILGFVVSTIILILY